MTIQTPEQIAREHLDRVFGGWPPQTANQVTALIEAAIEADRAQRADDIELPEEWQTTLRIIEGDGEEYTDAVRLTFTRDWDESLTRTHTVSWETFVKALVVVAREEEAKP